MRTDLSKWAFNVKIFTPYVNAHQKVTLVKKILIIRWIR